ncbi:hypothetical protein CTEN210_05425 [Chaetoceros tenuissimus]|uniref:Reverse transcriptase Ty1/copia-type domain-containing protein n=1 Tax=Chaetoceros tenuissimus TaxID=426638 RepID=A0AAD3H3V9_9STRA|nr:hypothetical protein CTEN210_05425 [Chaetoceros tenuissimus]
MAIPANQALLNMDADLLDFLTQSLNFSPALCNCLSFDGYDNTVDFVDWTYAEISKYCEVKSTKAIARGGCNWPERKKKDLQGFAFHITQRHLEGTQVDVAELDANGNHVLTLAIVRDFYEAAKIAEDKGDEVEMKKPDVLKSEDWVEWEKSIIHYLDGMRNRKGVPLSYVIRGNQPQNVQLTSDEQMIYAAALTGPQFNNDSKEVYNLIKELVQNTDGDSWLPPRCSCGRRAMQSLRNHYDGPDQAKARIDVARASIEKLFYRNENIFSFESYSTQMKKNYDVLEKYNQPEYEANKIDTFLKGIRNENNKVVNVVSIARTMANLNTFQLVQEFISNQLKSNFPPQEIQQGVKKGGGRCGVSAAKKRRQKAAKRKASRIAKLSISGRKENGVQLQGYDHFYSNKEFYALTQDTRDAILKARKDNNWVPGNRDDSNRNVDATATSIRNDDDMSSIGHSLAGKTITMDAAVLRGVMGTSASVGDQQQQVVPPSNGSHARSTSSASAKKYKVAKRIGLGWTERAATGHFKPSLEAYDYGFRDKAVEWVNFAWNNRKVIRYRDVCRIKTSDRRACSIEVSPLSAASRYETPLPTEMDNHADTHCFGKNFIILEYTRQQCSVAPFLAEYDETQNVDIVTGATAVDLEDGSTIVCVFGQGLWFGDRMEKSLINPNQCRHYGVSLCDDPTNPHRPLAIRKERFSIPMQMFNSSCGIESRRPTMEELESCPRVTLSDTHSWNPETVSFQISSLKEEQRTMHDWSWEHSKLDLPLTWLVSLVERPNGVQVPVFRDDTFISDFDRGLCHASSGLAQDLAVDSLVNSVKVQLQDSARIALASTEKSHHEVTKELLARKWGISIARAEATLKASTQLSVRSAIMPLSRRYRTDLLSQRLRRISTRVYTDTLLMKRKSSRSNTCAQVFTDGALAYVHPMQSKADAHEGLAAFGQDVGIPMEMISDNSKEQTAYGSDFMKILRKWRTSSRSIEPYSPWQNLAENVIGILKSKWKRRMVRRNVPAKVWDFGLVWEAEIYTRTAKPGGRTGIEAVTGETPDISEWLDFEFYDLCWYWDSLESKRKIGCWLGVSHRVGSAMCYWILSNTGNVLARTTVQHVLQSECNQEDIQEQIRAYHEAVSDAFGADNFVSDLDGFDKMINEDVPLVKETETGYSIHDDIAVPEIDDVVDHDDAVKQQDTYDMYIGAEVLFPNAVGDERMGKVVKRLCKNDGEPSNTGSYNPLHDTALYQVEFPSGLTENIQANIIAENMFAQVDSEGRHQQVLKEISDHSWDHTAIPRWDGYIKSKSGMVPKKTTRGWELLVEWKDGTMSWVPLKDLKNSNPVELAQYAVMNALEEEPAFKWLVPYTLKKRDAIVAKVKSKYWRTTHKFGILVYGFLKMENVRVAFEVLAGVTPEEMRTGKVRPGYKEIPCHMIFDIKMDGKFTRKARLVAGGHVTDPPSATTYSSVVSRDSVRIALTIASLNDLDLFACDVESAYLCADCLEKVWCVAGSEFGSDKGKVLLIVRALYGLKSSGAAWRAMLAKVLREEIHFVPTEADPDVYLRQASKANGELYYEMLLVYVDDILAVSEVAEELVGVFSRRGDGKRPFPSSYRPELDTSPELEDISKYQQYIGVLRWACELGRIDILTEVSVLSQHLCNPREGHLDAVYRIFNYLDKRRKAIPGKLGFDPVRPDDVVSPLDGASISKVDWTEFYPDAEEQMPRRMPTPHGAAVLTRAYVDANHAGNLANRRSHTGILIYMNNSPVLWYSKRQNTVETSSFGIEFVALCIAVEMVEALRYKLRCFGVPIDGPTEVLCDNKSVVTNSSVPASTLNKRHNAICYHRVREEQACGMIKVLWIEGKYNLADLFSKIYYCWRY